MAGAGLLPGIGQTDERNKSALTLEQQSQHTCASPYTHGGTNIQTLTVTVHSVTPDPAKLQIHMTYQTKQIASCTLDVMSVSLTPLLITSIHCEPQADVLHDAEGSLLGP